MKLIYNAIKKDLRKHPNVVSSILGIVPEWKRSQYIILSEIISKHLAKSEKLLGIKKAELGSTISHITLQRFFENDYQEKTHNDLRFLKTLDKICIFLDKNDLNDYIQKRYDVEEGIQPPNNLQSEKELILNFCQSQFNSLKNLPVLDTREIMQFVFENSPLYERIQTFIAEQSKKSLTFVTENNRSNFEIFQFNLISDQPELKVIETQEFWNLLLINHKKEKHIINRLNTQSYFIKKINNEWKIWDNYNPDYGKILKIN